MGKLRLAIAAAVCGVVATALLAACGGSGGSDFSAEANSICLHSVKEGTSIYVSPAGAMATRDDALTAQKRYVAIDESSDRRLGELSPPSDSADAYERYLAELRKATAIDKQALAAVEANREAAFGKLLREASGQGLKALAAAGKVPDLDVCAAKMPAKGAEEVEKTVEEGETTSDPAQCTDFFTANFVKLQWGSLAACREFQETEPPGKLPSSVDVNVKEGVEGVRATATITAHGGPNDGKTAELGLAYQDGRWKLAFAEFEE